MSKSSVVWDFFTLNVEAGRVKCGLCPVTMSHNRSSTSNMMRHMRLKHVTVDLNSRRRQNVVSEEQVDDPDIPEQGVSNSSRVSNLNLFQCKIYTYIKKKCKI